MALRRRSGSEKGSKESQSGINSTMNEKFKKLINIFRSPALHAIIQWSGPVHLSIILISALAVIGSLISLGVTLTTKLLIDGATSGNESALWNYGVMLVALIMVSRALSVWSSYIRTKASAVLQKHMQGLVTASILGKEYASLKGYHRDRKSVV